MPRTADPNAVGNERFEGYCADLAAKLSEEIEDINFQYELRLVKDNSYGAELDDGIWNGMIGELIQGVTFGLFITKTSRP